ncbi:helix-turn-helix domain-containing protein [Pseudooceanicola sp. CBS1P-1]|uniref:Helix-turn-helix domain-containing protein n=1 Tax=Pseudooceanicola albus TaxID=2692189 RepID=A0A6L7G835_9RHOB|nr:MULTISPECIES: helix-turn-helix domain-containing protein [Pseudooceanicola]MBT9386003.1 helix-turn-helix domain-containing protein [Pseudooceanicola endophyticus]MXN19576.1 helix-turn-helix domain-containing protein [Pseudooceanicola albus]
MPDPLIQTDAGPTPGWHSFSTASLEEAARRAGWQAAANTLFPSSVLEAAGAADFFGAVSWLRCGEVLVADFVSTAAEVSRGEEEIAEADLWYEACLQVEGDCRLAQGGRFIAVRPRDIVLYDSQQPYVMTFDGPYRQIALKLPRAGLRDRVPGIDGLILRPISGQSLPGRFLFDFVLTLCDEKAESGRAPLAIRLGSQITELLAMALSDMVSDQPLSAHRQGQLARVKAHILAHLDDPALNPGAIAEAQDMSLRSLYELFEAEEVPVSGWIRTQRLERIRRDLGDSLLASWPIATIALRRGFKDVAHFSRAFRAQYGISPRAYRKARQG